MNVLDVLRYGHLTVKNSLEPLPREGWLAPGVCGVWSVKDIVAHLASFEHMLIDVIEAMLGEGETPTLDRMATLGGQGFNDREVAQRSDWTADQVWAEYEQTFNRAWQSVSEVPEELFRQNGLVRGYGDEYDLEDYLVYSFYGHKREHTAQINVYKDLLK
jgi:uncharacterized damage-inducible protein DinB